MTSLASGTRASTRSVRMPRHEADCTPPSRPLQRAFQRSIGGADIPATIGVDLERLCPPLDDFPIDDDLADADQARQFEHRIEKNRFHDGAQSARTSLACDGL